jgi:hypothetical protein
MPKTPALPKLTSDFALLDIKLGRRKLAKIVEAGHKIPFTISGYIQAGHGGIGHDDGVSIEFAADVEVADFGEPITA